MTWDTLDTQPYCVAAGLAISGGGLIASTASSSFTANNQCLATPFEGKNAGKLCVEFKCVASGGGDDAFGVTSAAAIALAGGNGYGFIGGTGGSGYVGQFGLGYKQDGDINNNRLYLIGQNPIVRWGTWGAGDYLYIALDLDNGIFWFRINNGPWLGLTNTGSPTLGTGGIPLSSLTLVNTGVGYRLFPAVSFGQNGQYNCNFGQSAFAYAAPSGFTAGWTNTGQLNFGSFLSNGVGGFLNGTQVVVSPYVSGVTGTLNNIRGVGCSGANTAALGVIYDSDGAGGAPYTLLGKSAVGGGGTETVYNLLASFRGLSGHLYHLGVYYQENGGIRSIPIAAGAANGMYVDTSATWPTPNAHFNVSSIANNHLPMLAEFSSGVIGPGATGKVLSQAHIFGR